MRHFVITGGMVCLLAVATLEAAVIKGRVVDSAGQPVVGAEIRVWRKTKLVGRILVRPSELVSFDGEESLLADHAGRFETPDVFDATMRVRLTAQASGMLAGRSGWFLPQQEATEVDDIVLARLRSVTGRVVDARGAAIAGATVFNGEGHQRVETKTGSTGKFFLEDVPENALFLFAEKAGYRLTGIVLEAQEPVELRVAGSDEPVEPLKSRDPLLSAEERVAVAHRLLDPYLEGFAGKRLLARGRLLGTGGLST